MRTKLRAATGLLTLIVFSFIPAHGDTTDDSGIRIRVHVPHGMRLGDDEFQNYIVRIENRGDTLLPVLTSHTYRFNDTGEPVQSRMQTRKEVRAGDSVPIENWEAIKKKAQPSEFLKEPSVLEPGMAVELTRLRLATGALPDGESRIAIQIGPDKFAYSNWVNVETLPKVDTSEWPVVVEQDINEAPLDEYAYIVHEEATGKWLFARPNQNRNALWRVCHLPDAEMPVIENDWERHQAAIIFPNHPESTCYYSTIIGISRSKPWPKRAIASDLSGKFIPVDAPSPLEFPLELFAGEKNPPSGNTDHDGSKPRADSGSARSHSASDTSTGKSPEDSASESTGRPPLWIWIAGACALAATLALMLLPARKKKR